MATRWEWGEQVKLAGWLAKWLDPGVAFATAMDSVAASAIAGAMRRKRGVKPGLPDNWVLYRGRLITIELKSPTGRCSRAQREVRERLRKQGVQWFECRTAAAAMWALRKAGVRFRIITNADGTTEAWQQPALADWEIPRTDPSEKRPAHPAVREARARWRERRRAEREAATIQKRIPTNKRKSQGGRHDEAQETRPP